MVLNLVSRVLCVGLRIIFVLGLIMDLFWWLGFGLGVGLSVYCDVCMFVV